MMDIVRVLACLALLSIFLGIACLAIVAEEAALREDGILDASVSPPPRRRS